jgi:mRNA-degrading endonuclease RelE of RelBE toxin-antitoxin system
VDLVRTERFKRAYRKLEPRYRGQVKKALAQLLADRTHPGLRVKRIRGTEKVWELRAGRDIRVTFEIEQGVYILRNVGHHDPTLRNP